MTASGPENLAPTCPGATAGRWFRRTRWCAFRAEVAAAVSSGGWVNEETDTGRRLRDVMSRFPTGVTVVAAVGPEGRPFGLTVNSFTSVSLDPPLVLVCIDREAASHDPLMASSHFAVNVLASEQPDVADRFAGEPARSRFDDVSWQASALGAPLVEGAAAWLECSRHEVYEVGDHSILVGKVESTGAREGASLLYHRGRYGSAGT